MTPHPRADRHRIAHDGPAVNFFQGGVLGNGGLGAIVVTRPDALVVHFGHNDVWDIRIAEKNRDQLLTFQKVFDRVRALPADLPRLTDDPWFDAYVKTTTENYGKPYPRPMPCGTLVLGWDRRRPCDMLGHEVNPADGTCIVRLLDRGAEVQVTLFTDMAADRLWIGATDPAGRPCATPFNRVALVTDRATPAEFPRRTAHAREDGFAFRQVLPALEPDAYDPAQGHPGDRAFALAVRLTGQLATGTRLNWDSNPEPLGELERLLTPGLPFVACAQLTCGPASQVAASVNEWMPPAPTPTAFTAAQAASRTLWSGFWARSSVELDDAELERIWYRNLYFFRCAVRRGVTCPGLFANWSCYDIGTAWHGDYHMNYNTQQPFWVAFSSNHVELHEPYVRMVNDLLLPLSRLHARDYYELPGAVFPHTAYPVTMTMFPYPSPVWGWEICETPWSVQSHWWHFLYTRDREFLRRDAFPPIKAAVEFMVAYLDRPDAHGPQWGDDHHHIFPTVSPEMHGGLKPGLKFNRDCLVDLTLTRFLFRSFTAACRELGCEAAEHTLLAAVTRLADKLPPYSTAPTKDFGEVYVDVPGGPPEVVFNVPNQLMTVFPGEEHGLHSPPEIRQLCANTLAAHRNEGGNHLVFLHLQAARIGGLDLERFKREVRYCTLANGTAADKCMQAGGRYEDITTFDFMAPMGIWFENFSLPAVINECLLQSYHGELRLFPNWPASTGDAAFRTLRAAGAFLVSARRESGRTAWIEVKSEAGGELRLVNPWPRARIERSDTAVTISSDALIALPTKPGETLVFAEEP